MPPRVATMTDTPFLRTAIRAVEAAERVIKRHYESNLRVEIKADRTPVTVADVEAERSIRAVIEAAFPDHGFYGEETGRDRAGAEHTWLVDPIDGTKSFIREIPFFSTQIALMQGHEFIMGVSNAPAFQEMAFAQRGLGAYLDDHRIRVSAIDDLAEATLSLGNIKTLASGPRWGALAGLVGRVNRTRGYGDFYHYHLLAAGKIDVVVESDVNILDVAAASVIVTEAGGCVTDLEGGSLDLDSTTIVATNARLHPEVLDALAAPP